MFGFLLLWALASPTFGQMTQVETSKSPCPYVLVYEPETDLGRWYAVIYLSTDTTLHSLWLNIILDNPAKFLGNWLGSVNTEDNLDYEIVNKQFKINPGPAETFRFFVEYDPMNDTPRVKNIRFNGKEIIITLTHSKTRGLRQTGLTLQSLSIHCLRSEARVCLMLKRYQLIVGANVKLDKVYICGGTLLSHRHTITAAHCVCRKGTSTVVNINTLSVHLGKHNLEVFSDGAIIRYLEKITLDPEFNATIFSRNMAILELKEPVPYTDWVWPACLWPQNLISLSNVIGKTGTVVGWGIDDSGNPTRDLNSVELSVVDTDTCIESYVQFYSIYVSEFNYCAGANNASLCNGDSGGGMMFKIGGRWYLRGLVSLMLAKPGKVACDPTYYAIFTDTTKLLPWIRRNIYDL